MAQEEEGSGRWNVCECDLHFVATYIVRTDEGFLSRDAASLERQGANWRPEAIPNSFNVLPLYLSNPNGRRRPLI